MDDKMQQSVDINKPQIEKRPDERGGIDVQSHIKIFDPETNEVFVQERA
jgi:hypothetical protein